MAAALGQGGGDPGRVHEEGRIARVAIEEWRESVASFLGVCGRQVVFTSSGTEAINTAVFAAARSRPGGRMLTADVEHSAVRDAARRFAPTEVVAVDGNGRLDVDALVDALSGSGPEAPALVNCQWANHEVGTIQPVEEVAAACSAASVPLHVDASAACGHVPLDLGALGAEYVSLSGHKFGGPPGIGVLVLRRGLRLEPFLVGAARSASGAAASRTDRRSPDLPRRCRASARRAPSTSRRRSSAHSWPRSWQRRRQSRGCRSWVTQKRRGACRTSCASASTVSRPSPS